MGKKPKPTFHRTTISIPYNLKEQMDNAPQDVNWSAIAARAFEEKLGEIAAKKEKKNMDDVIQRLRASKAKSEDSAYSGGVEHGKGWVDDTAEVDELKRLQALRDRCGRDWDDSFSDDRNSAYSTAEWIAFEIRDADGDRDAASDFWEIAVGDGGEKLASDSAFVKGFAEGALARWAEVESKL